MLNPDCPVCGLTFERMTLLDLAFSIQGRPGFASVRSVILELGPEHPVFVCAFCEIWHAWSEPGQGAAFRRVRRTA